MTSILVRRYSAARLISHALLMIAIGMTSMTARAEADDSQVIASAQHVPLEAPQRGFYVDGRFAAGYMVLNENVPQSDTVITAAGKSESLGGTIAAQLVVGYDITRWIAIELMGGVVQASGGRHDRVRDLGILFGGIGVRGSYDVTARWRLNTGISAGYASNNNAIESAVGSAWIQTSGGAEYALFVDHFAIGCDVMLFTTVAPTRMFVALTPHIKYTF